MTIIMLSTNHSLLEAAAVNETISHVLSLLSDHPIYAQLPAHVSDRVQYPKYCCPLTTVPILKLQQLVKINETISHMLRIYCLIIQYVLNCLHLYLTVYNHYWNCFV